MCVKVAYVNFNNKRRYDDDDLDGLVATWKVDVINVAFYYFNIRNTFKI